MRPEEIAIVWFDEVRQWYAYAVASPTPVAMSASPYEALRAAAQRYGATDDDYELLRESEGYKMFGLIESAENASDVRAAVPLGPDEAIPF